VRAAVYAWLAIGCGGPVASPAGGSVILSFDGHTTFSWATFWDDGPEVTPDSWADFGPCHVLTASGSATSNPILTAGTVTITGGMQPVTLMPGNNGYYPFGQGTIGRLWNGGEVLTMSATGDPKGVPAFSGTVVAPTHITLVAPVFTNGNVDVPRDQPFHLAWTGGTVGTIWFNMSGPIPDGPSDTYCEFPAAAGEATISQDLIGQLPAGWASVHVAQVNRAIVPAGRFPIELRVAESVTDGVLNFR